MFVYNTCLRNKSFPALVSVIHWSHTYNHLGVSQVWDDEEGVICFQPCNYLGFIFFN